MKVERNKVVRELFINGMEILLRRVREEECLRCSHGFGRYTFRAEISG